MRHNMQTEFSYFIYTHPDTMSYNLRTGYIGLTHEINGTSKVQTTLQANTRAPKMQEYQKEYCKIYKTQKKIQEIVNLLIQLNDILLQIK